MSGLITKISAGEGHDRDTDIDIAWATGWRMRDGDWIQPKDFRIPIGTLAAPPLFTGSVDAALTIVPEGWGGSLHIEERGKWAIVKLGRSYPTNAEVTVEARTLPRAICLAALKAGMVDL